MNELLGWAVMPLALYVLALGLGLLAERLTRFALPDELLAPVGFCLAICLIMPVFKLGLGSGPAAAAILAPAALGLWTARADLLRRGLPRWGLGAGIAAYGLYLAPVLLTGHWTWLGYNFVNDTSVNFVFADHLAHHGLARAAGPPSTTQAAADVIQGGYPVGSHGLIATLTTISRAPIEVIYQPFIAACAGLAALATMPLSRRAGLGPRRAALVGVMAVAANLLYQYAAHGAIKEVTLLVTVVAAAALAGVLLDARLDPRGAVLVGVCFAAGLAAFGAGTFGYAGALAAVVVVVAIVEPGRPHAAALARALAAATLALVVVSLPTLSDTISFGRFSSDAFSGKGGLTGPGTAGPLGHLLRPLPVGQVAGIWPANDYRLPVPTDRTGLTAVLIAGIFAAAALAVLLEARRRRFGALLVLAPALITWIVLAPRVSPYADAKLELIASPLVVFAAGLALARATRRAVPLAALLALPLAGGVLWSDATAYHQVRLAPPQRLEAMSDAARHATGGGLWLLNEWEEFGKYFMRGIRMNAPAEAFAPQPIQLRVPPTGTFGRHFDLDDETLAYVESFPGIIKRRAPDASRPPANFRLEYRNRFYEVWRRTPGLTVLEHLPLQAVNQPAQRPLCRRVLRLAARALPGERLIAARRPELFELQTAAPGVHSPGWVPEPSIQGIVVPATPGRAEGDALLAGGRYEVWIAGSTGRPLTAWVDGRAVGRVLGVNTPGQWLTAATVELDAGTHRVGITRPGGDLRPGDGYAGQIGPLALQSTARGSLVSVDPGRARDLCDGEWDWIERASGSAP